MFCCGTPFPAAVTSFEHIPRILVATSPSECLLRAQTHQASKLDHTKYISDDSGTRADQLDLLTFSLQLRCCQIARVNTAVSGPEMWLFREVYISYKYFHILSRPRAKSDENTKYKILQYKIQVLHSSVCVPEASCMIRTTKIRKYNILRWLSVLLQR